MKQIVVVPLIAITSLLGVQFVSATLAVAQQGQAESPQRDVLLPPRVDRVRLRATAIYWGMSAAEVDQTMGAAADEETYQGMDGNVRVLTYPREAIPTKITISDGKVASVALDIAGIDARLPAYSRSAWPGMHRTVVLRMLGVPVEDRSMTALA